MSEPFVEIVAQAVNQLYELAQKYRDRWDDFGGRQLKIEVGAILDPVMNALEAARGVVPSAPSLQQIAQFPGVARHAEALEDDARRFPGRSSESPRACGVTACMTTPLRCNGTSTMRHPFLFTGTISSPERCAYHPRVPCR